MNTASHHDHIEVPRGPLLGIAALLAIAIVAAALARWASGGQSPSAPTAPVVAERALRFVDQPDGGIEVRQADTAGALVRRIAPGEEPFVRGALRALVRVRRGAGIDMVPPFRLEAHADGRLTLQDDATGQRIDLESFGPAQAAPFAALLAPRTSATTVATTAGPAGAGAAR